MKKFGVSILMAVLIAQILLLCFSSAAESLVQSPHERLTGIGYGPFRDGQDPDQGIYPDLKELTEDIVLLKDITHSLRTYGMGGSGKDIPKLCNKLKINCFPGAWISKNNRDNAKEIKTLVDIGKERLSFVKGLIVGNEVLLRRDLTEEALIHLIRQVKKDTGLPVTMAETWSIWMKSPALVAEVDFVMVHIHPYWDGISVTEAAEQVIERWKALKEMYPDKEIVIGETGWPSAGETIGQAVPSEDNQAKFFTEFVRLASMNRVKYFYFEAFDEKWKVKFEGQVGAHWGLYYSNGSVKPLSKDYLPLEARKGIKRIPRAIRPVTVSAPLTVWDDADSPRNRFFLTGWMGETNAIFIDDECRESPYSGKTCLKISFTPKRSNSWAGIYFQYPINNWGNHPGYTISGARKVTFWARGEKGGEKAEFKAGGIYSPGKPYMDSFGPISSGVINLSGNWRQYSLDISKENLNSVMGGFCWITNALLNPKGSIIYLDKILIE